MTDEEYKVHIALTRGREILCLACFTKDSAQLAYDIVTQTRPQRIATAKGLFEAVTKLGNDQHITATLKSEGGIIKNVPVRLSPDTARLLVTVSIMDVESSLELFKSDLLRIIAGTAANGAILKPFLAAEGFKQKVGSST